MLPHVEKKGVLRFICIKVASETIFTPFTVDFDTQVGPSLYIY